MMLEKGKMNAGEFSIIVFTFTVGTAIISLPALLATIAKQNAWIASALTIFPSLLFIFVYIQLISLYPSMTYVEVNEKILGKWFGKLASVLYLTYVLIITSGGYRAIGDFFTTQVMVDTPIQVIIILFVLTSVFGVRLGLEVICRTALIFFPWIILLLSILFLFLIPQIKLENIQPIFGEGIKPIISGSLHQLGLPYLQLIILLMVTPFVAEKSEMKKSFYLATIMGGFILTIIVLFSILVLGADFTSRQAYPTYILGKKISIGNFFERVEVIVAIIWVFTIYFKVTICYYGLTLGLAQLLGLKNYQILTFPLSFLILPFSILLLPNVVSINNFNATTLTPYSLTICFILPLLLVVVDKVRKKLSTSKTTNQSSG
ncbi:spore germination protein KB [Neobacillus niacini]|uniref:GerAB/ArcD/ProY family transporter n=1 Tax=Neobacillus niacini TaxID=86668 RepID=UPI00285DE95A|nr:endospore germination permease [Neobacillus niacini]MDR7077125.1 spore germination protein KB [Neobacillus niacini]